MPKRTLGRGIQRRVYEPMLDQLNNHCEGISREIADRIRHMKPWAKCKTGAEHFDVYNYLLFAPPPIGTVLLRG